MIVTLKIYLLVMIDVLVLKGLEQSIWIMVSSRMHYVFLIYPAIFY